MPYDIAQICLNGHVINDSCGKYPEFSKEHCPRCGELTIVKCPECQKNIKGALEGGYSLKSIPAPKFCEYCGCPFPWTESALSAAKELADGLDVLSDDEKEDLKQSIDDMVKDTPRTTVTVQKFKKLAEKAGDQVPALFKVILIDILAQGAVHMLGWR